MGSFTLKETRLMRGLRRIGKQVLPEFPTREELDRSYELLVNNAGIVESRLVGVGFAVGKGEDRAPESSGDAGIDRFRQRNYSLIDELVDSVKDVARWAQKGKLRQLLQRKQALQSLATYNRAIALPPRTKLDRDGLQVAQGSAYGRQRELLDQIQGYKPAAQLHAAILDANQHTKGAGPTPG